ncbi:MAG TPA: hypothetical protein VGN22_00815 [Pseudonocardia sp.]
MREPGEVLESTQWSELEHAYGSAAEAPFQLIELLKDDPDQVGDALAFLDAAVLHQGSLYSVTAPAAEYVAAILDDPRTMVLCESALPWDDRERPARAAMLEWLGLFGQSVAYAEHDPDEDAAVVEACRAVRNDLVDRVALFLDDPDPDVRASALGALSHLLVAPELEARRGPFAARLTEAAAEMDVTQRASVAMTLGAWGIAPRDLLRDPHPAVRGCAAMAPAFDDDPDALAELRAALRDPKAADEWFAFGQRPPQFEAHVRFALLATLLRRTTTFEEVVEEAVAIARMTNEHTVDSDWGPLLVRAAGGSWLSEGPRRFLTAIVENDACWTDRIANKGSWLRKVGLPGRREELRALLDER